MIRSNIKKQIKSYFNAGNDEHYPNFFVTGKAESSREDLGLEIAKELENSGELYFKGILPSFSIRVPYLRDEAETEQFLARLKDSVSIARDCYDEFQGIVLMELHQEWEWKGFNNSLLNVMYYIQHHPRISFILLFPAEKENPKTISFFNELCASGYWIRCDTKSFTPQQCVDHFRKAAESKGFSVSPQAGNALRKQLEQRNELFLDNLTVTRQILERILMDRQLQNKENLTISLSDIQFIPGTSDNRLKIGFVPENR